MKRDLIIKMERNGRRNRRRVVNIERVEIGIGWRKMEKERKKRIIVEEEIGIEIERREEKMSEVIEIFKRKEFSELRM